MMFFADYSSSREWHGSPCPSRNLHFRCYPFDFVWCGSQMTWLLVDSCGIPRMKEFCAPSAAANLPLALPWQSNWISSQMRALSPLNTATGQILAGLFLCGQPFASGF